MRRFHILFLIIVGFSCLAQKPYLENGKVGFKNELGFVIIQPQYDSVSYFGSNILYPAPQPKKYVFDKKFLPGIAQVKKDGVWSMIQKDGMELDTIKSQERFVRKDLPRPSLKYPKKSYTKIIDPSTSYWALYDLEKGQTTGIRYQSEKNRKKGYYYQPGIIRGTIIAKRIDGHYDLIDGKDATLLLEDKRYIKRMEGSQVRYTDKDGSYHLYNVDTKKDKETPFGSDLLHGSTNHRMIVGRPGRVGVVTAENRLIVDTAYLEVDMRMNHIVGVHLERHAQDSFTRTAHLFDYSGNPLETPPCKTIDIGSGHYLKCISQDGKKTLLDGFGTAVTPLYDNIERDRKTGWFFYEEENGCGIMNEQAEVIWTSNADKVLRTFKNGHIEVATDSLHGIMDLAEEFIYPIKYLSVKPFNNHYVFKTMSRQVGLGDKNGKTLIEPVYDAIRKSYTKEKKGIWCIKACDATIYNEALEIIGTERVRHLSKDCMLPKRSIRGSR